MRRLLAAALLLACADACATSGRLREAARASRTAPLKPVNLLSDVRRLHSGLWPAAFQVEGRRDLQVRLAVQAGAACQPAGKAQLFAAGAHQLRDTFRSLALGREAIVVEGDAKALAPSLEEVGLPVERWVLPPGP